MVINIFSKKEHQPVSKENVYFKHAESGSNYTMDEQFITWERKKVQDTEETNKEYHNSVPDKPSNSSENLKLHTKNNNDPTRDHAELDPLEEENAETLHTKDDERLESVLGNVNNRTNQKYWHP